MVLQNVRSKTKSISVLTGQALFPSIATGNAGQHLFPESLG
jgi:hypothetical protein